MAASFFGQYLLIKGIVEREQLNEALAYQYSHNKTLGQLAVDRGLLSRAQSSQINLRQRDTDVLFGDLAESLGWLSREQIAQLLAEQTRQHTTVGRVLIRQGVISQTYLQHLLADYHYWHIRNQRECNRRVAASALAPEVEGFSYLLSRQLEREFGLRAQPNTVSNRRPAVLPQWSWRLVDDRSTAVVGVAPAPTLLQTLSDRQRLIWSMPRNARCAAPDGCGAAVQPEDFFARLLHQLAGDSEQYCLEVMDEGHARQRSVGESLCVGYSVEGDPLQVYFCTGY